MIRLHPLKVALRWAVTVVVGLGMGPARAGCPRGLEQSSSAYAARAYTLSEQGDYVAAAEQSWSAYCKERNLRFLVNICVFHVKSGRLNQAQEVIRLARRRPGRARPQDREGLEQCAAEVQRQRAAGAAPTSSGQGSSSGLAGPAAPTAAVPARPVAADALGGGGVRAVVRRGVVVIEGLPAGEHRIAISGTGALEWQGVVLVEPSGVGRAQVAKK